MRGRHSPQHCLCLLNKLRPRNTRVKAKWVTIRINSTTSLPGGWDISSLRYSVTHRVTWAIRDMIALIRVHLRLSSIFLPLFSLAVVEKVNGVNTAVRIIPGYLRMVIRDVFNPSWTRMTTRENIRFGRKSAMPWIQAGIQKNLPRICNASARAGCKNHLPQPAMQRSSKLSETCFCGPTGIG